MLTSLHRGLVVYAALHVLGLQLSNLLDNTLHHSPIVPEYQNVCAFSLVSSAD